MKNTFTLLALSFLLLASSCTQQQYRGARNYAYEAAQKRKRDHKPLFTPTFNGDRGKQNKKKLTKTGEVFFLRQLAKTGRWPKNTTVRESRVKTVEVAKARTAKFTQVD